MPEQTSAADAPDDPQAAASGAGPAGPTDATTPTTPAAPAEPAPPAAQDPAERELADEVDAVLRGRLRRAPRYGAFITVGVLAGLVVGLLVPFAGRGGWSAGVALFLSAAGVVIGAVTGAAVAALVDLRSTR